MNKRMNTKIKTVYLELILDNFLFPRELTNEINKLRLILKRFYIFITKFIIILNIEYFNKA